MLRGSRYWCSFSTIASMDYNASEFVTKEGIRAE